MSAEVQLLTLRCILIPAADQEDRWLTCLLCEKPSYHEGVAYGKPVDYVIHLQGDGVSRGHGLHERCLQKQNRVTARAPAPTEDQ